MIVYLYRILDQEEEVIAEGCLDNSVDILVEDVIPNVSTSSDRNLSEMQKFLDRNYSELGYKFEYKEKKVDW